MGAVLFYILSKKTSLGLILPGFNDEANIVTLSKNFELINAFLIISNSFASFDLTESTWEVINTNSTKTLYGTVYSLDKDDYSYFSYAILNVLHIPLHNASNDYSIYIGNISEQETTFDIFFITPDDVINKSKGDTIIATFSGFPSEISGVN